jgi:hypothetical protein
MGIPVILKPESGIFFIYILPIDPTNKISDLGSQFSISLAIDRAGKI